jgi:hypothetical protein
MPGKRRLGYLKSWFAFTVGGAKVTHVRYRRRRRDNRTNKGAIASHACRLASRNGSGHIHGMLLVFCITFLTEKATELIAQKYG